MYVPTPPPSARAKELAAYLSQVVQAYQADHPELTAEEVRQALELNTPRSPAAVKAVLAGLAALVAFGAVGFYAVSEGGAGEAFPWMLVTVGGLVIVIAGVAVLRRRT